jgi:hypothetical protein
MTHNQIRLKKGKTKKTANAMPGDLYRLKQTSNNPLIFTSQGSDRNRVESYNTGDIVMFLDFYHDQDFQGFIDGIFLGPNGRRFIMSEYFFKELRPINYV